MAGLVWALVGRGSPTEEGRQRRLGGLIQPPPPHNHHHTYITATTTTITTSTTFNIWSPPQPLPHSMVKQPLSVLSPSCGTNYMSTNGVHISLEHISIVLICYHMHLQGNLTTQLGDFCIVHSLHWSCQHPINRWGTAQQYANWITHYTETLGVPVSGHYLHTNHY